MIVNYLFLDLIEYWVLAETKILPKLSWVCEEADGGEEGCVCNIIFHLCS